MNNLKDAVVFIKQNTKHSKNCEFDIKEENDRCNCGLLKAIETLEWHSGKQCPICEQDLTFKEKDNILPNNPVPPEYIECKLCQRFWDSSGKPVSFPIDYMFLPKEFFIKR